MDSSISKKSRHSIGIFSAWFGGGYQSELVSGIEHEAGQNDVQIFYFVSRALNSPHPYKDDDTAVFDAALDASLDGIIIMPMLALADYATDAQISAFVSRFASVPLVTVGFKTSYGKAILTDAAPGFCSLMNHLTDDHGYRKLAFLNGPEKNPNSIERLRIYSSALESKGIPLDSTLLLNGYFSYASGKKAMCTYIDERGLAPGRDIEAIVCANDQMAWGVIAELESRGFRIPRDIAVTGFDDAHPIDSNIPAITTVNQHVFEIGKTAVSMLLAHDKMQEDPVIDTELVVRNSCGAHGTIGDSNQKSDTIVDFVKYSDPETSESSKKIIDSKDRINDNVLLSIEIDSILSNLRVLKNINELDEWLVRSMPNFKIGSAYIFLYSDLPSHSRFVRLIALYDRTHQRIDGEKRLPLQSVFDDILSANGKKSYCILPLCYNDEQYGLFAVEINYNVALVYDRLDVPIGSSIKSMLLMEELNNMNRKLGEMNNLLREANEQKTQFFINVAHETKTPLTLIQNYLERSMERFTSDPDLTVVKQNIDILLENMLNFLDAERLEKGAVSFTHETFMDLSESARKKCDLFRAVAEKKNIAMDLTAKDGIVIKIDPWALDRILNNLLDNAVKYTQAGGKVSVEVKRTDGKAVLCVSDNGPGLSDDTIAHMFEPYYQLSRKRSSKQGIGVGLSIVKKILDDLGASIEVTNRKSGGACFTVFFTEVQKIARTAHLHDIPLSTPSAGIISGDDITKEDISEEKTSILIVDDNVRMLNFLKESLRHAYNIFIATDVTSALARLESIERPELIVSDIMMDGLDGHALLATLSKTDEYCDIPFIFLTAIGDKDEEMRGLSEGAIDYIKKPFSVKELEKKIESIIALRGRMKKHEIMKIRKGIDGLLSNIEDKKNRKPVATFDSLCIEYGLSYREKETLTLLLEGLLNKEIAFQLHLSQRAVEYNITSIFKKVGIKKKYDLLAKFRQ